MDDRHGRFDAADIEYCYESTRTISSGHWNGRYDGLFDHIVVAMEAGVASPWRQQGGQFESHNGRRMRGRAFELVEGVEGFN